MRRHRALIRSMVMAAMLVASLAVPSSPVAAGPSGAGAESGGAGSGYPGPGGAANSVPQVRGSGAGANARALAGPYTFTVAPSQQVTYDVRFENNGTTTWTTAAGYALMNVDTSNSFPLGSPLAQGGCDSLPSGQGAWCNWSITFTAGLTPGTFTWHYRMAHNGNPFGDTIAVTFTVSSSLVGGHGLSLQGGSGLLTWAGGTTQTGYLVVRWSPASGFTFMPSPTSFLPGTQTSFIDPGPVPNPSCYLLVPLAGSPPSLTQVLGISDFFCLYPGTGSGSNRPGQFTIRLNESGTASLTWTGAVGQTNYQLIASRFDGSADRTIPLNGGATSFSEALGGKATCYQLVARNGTTVLGTTDKVCAVPGVANLSSTAAPQSVQAGLERAQQAMSTSR